MKNIYFLCGLPRCGNTLLASILNQNSDIMVTAHSIAAEIIYVLNEIKQTINFKNFPDHSSLDNLIKTSLSTYFKDYKSNHIIDRGPWGTAKNLNLIEKYITLNPKFIILERPFIEILGSFARIENFNKKELEDYCYDQMTGGPLTLFSYSIYNILQSKHDYIRISYEELVKNPKNTIQNIYKFLDIPEQNHRYVNLNQLTINNVQYDDTVLGKTYHDVKEDKVEKNSYDINMYLTPKIIEKYKDLSLEKFGKAIINDEALF
jgi:hypothetical protein